MSVATVFSDDLRNTRRSFVVVGVVGVLTAFVGLILGADASAHDHAYRALYDVSFFLFLAFPLILAPLTYLAIAGDRSTGTIKHALGLPNSRAAYVAGTYLSRASVGVVAVLVAMAVGYAVSVASYSTAVDPIRFAKFAGVTALFAVSMTGIFVAISATTSRRSRAMVGVVAAYVVLGPFWLGFLPVANLGSVIDAVTSVLGVTLSETTTSLIQNLSPAAAYLNATDIVYAGVMGEYETIQRTFDGPTEFYDRLWFNALVMTAWSAATLAVGYARFRVAELG